MTVHKPRRCWKGSTPTPCRADKGYDADELINWIQQTGALVVIPPRSNRTVLRDYDKARYKERHRVERMLGYLKHFRRVATRYDKTALSFLSFVQLAASYLWLK